MTLLFLYLFIALFFSFLCSIAEAVLLSTPNSYLVVKKNQGNEWAEKFLNLKNNIDKPLSAILSLNTVAHTIGAAGVGAQAIKLYGEAAFGIISAVLTLLILVFTEIIPKTIGASYWKNLSKFTSHIIGIMIIFTYPLVILSNVITRTISPKIKDFSTSREEISALTSMGASEGIFTEKEKKIIQNFLQLKGVKVQSIMTPRVVVAQANEETLLKDFLKNKGYLMFSRIPVYAEDEENITGYVLRQEAFEKMAEVKDHLKLKDIKRDILIVPNTNALFTVWETLLTKKEHIALVVDEYGGVDGIVTMEDIIESLLGLEIVDEKDTVTDMQSFAREKWKMRQAKYEMLFKLNEKSQK